VATIPAVYRYSHVKVVDRATCTVEWVRGSDTPRKLGRSLADMAMRRGWTLLSKTGLHRLNREACYYTIRMEQPQPNGPAKRKDIEVVFRSPDINELGAI
jgi:hypothetical protein